MNISFLFEFTGDRSSHRIPSNERYKIMMKKREKKRKRKRKRECRERRCKRQVGYISLVEVQRVRAQVRYRESRIGINERIVE